MKDYLLQKEYEEVVAKEEEEERQREAVRRVTAKDLEKFQERVCRRWR